MNGIGGAAQAREVGSARIVGAPSATSPAMSRFLASTTYIAIEVAPGEAQFAGLYWVDGSIDSDSRPVRLYSDWFNLGGVTSSRLWLFRGRVHTVIPSGISDREASETMSEYARALSVAQTGAGSTDAQRRILADVVDSRGLADTAAMSGSSDPSAGLPLTSERRGNRPAPMADASITMIDCHQVGDPQYWTFDLEEMIGWLGDEGRALFEEVVSCRGPKQVPLDAGGIRLWVAGALSPNPPVDVLEWRATVGATTLRRIMEYASGRELPLTFDASGTDVPPVVASLRQIGLVRRTRGVVTQTQLQLIEEMDRIGQGDPGIDVFVEDPSFLRRLNEPVTCQSCEAHLTAQRAFWSGWSPRCVACHRQKQLEAAKKTSEEWTYRSRRYEAPPATVTRHSDAVPFGLGFLIGRSLGGG